MSIKAYYNKDLIGEGDDTRNVGIEIYQHSTGSIDFEFFETEKEALSRVEDINNLNTSSWEDISPRKKTQQKAKKKLKTPSQ